jgi:hypothetical protein
VTEAELAPANLRRILLDVATDADGSYLLPRFGIRPGEKVLIAAPGFFDSRVLDAMTAAIEAASGRKPDVMIDNAPWTYGPGGEEELRLFRHYYVGPKSVEKTFGFDETQVHAFCAAGGYDVLIYGAGGSLTATGERPAYRWCHLLQGRAPYYASGLVNYPQTLQRTLDLAGWRILTRARRIRVTDPEGTDLRWSLRRGDFELTKARMGLDIVLQGHLNAVPFGVPLPEDGEGVIAGTVNHYGLFPRAALRVKGSRIVSIEGGGAYGEGWRAAIDELKDVGFPGHPGPGWSWLMESAIGTNPKAVRARTMIGCSPTTGERLRSGLVHFGLGAALVAPGTGASTEAAAADKRAYREFLEANGLPDGHFHVHVQFATMDIETWGGETIRLIDQGRYAPLDDPEVREIAATVGDPEELLEEAWIPAVPGINAAGDYERDYAVDPLAWVNERSELAGAPG